MAWKRRNGWGGMVLTTALLLVGGGCEKKRDPVVGKPEPIPPEKQLVLDPDRQIKALPVPIGFTWSATQSRSYRSGGKRIIDHVYEGGASLPQLVAFYQKFMKQFGWKKTSARHEANSFRASYVKGDETCSLILYESGWWKRAIRLVVEPRR